MPHSALPLFTLLGALAAFAALGTACGGDDISDAPPLTELQVECKPDQELLAQQISCALDEGCPCGSHCDLGVCTATCTKDSDCDEGRCDAFGRCTERPGQIPEIDDAPTALLSIVPTRVKLFDAEPSSLFLDAVEHDTGRIRIVADEPLEVSCDGVAFDTSCVVENLPVEIAGPLRIDIRRRDAGDAFVGVVSVNVHWASGSFAVPVAVAPQVAAAFGDAAIPCTNVDSGTYEGTARLVAIGASSTDGAASPLDNALADVTIPLTAQLYPAGAGAVGRVHIEDGLGALFGPHGATGDISDEGPTLVATDYLQGSGPAARSTYNIGDGPNSYEPRVVDLGVGFTAGAWTCGPDYLGGSLDVAFLGLVGDAPFLRWELRLDRLGDLAEGEPPPALPAAWSRSFPLDAEFTPTDSFGQVVHRSDPTLRFNGAAFASDEASDGRVGDPVSLAPPCSNRESCACGGTDPGVYDTVSAPGRTGDLGCLPDSDGQQAQRLFPLFNRPTLVDTDVEDCLADFATAAAGTDDGPASCIDTGRALKFLARDLAQSRKAALAPPGGAQDELGNKLALRTLQQWMAVAAFVARDADEITLRTRRMGKSIDETLFGVTAPSFTLAEALLGSIDASSLILHPLVAPALAGMQPDDLAAPDYRSLAAPTLAIEPARTHDQPVGLPVSILRTQTAQLQTLQSFAQSVIWRQTPHSELTPVFSTAWRTILPAMALAHVAAERARTVGELDWQAEWDNAETRVAGAMLEALERYESALRGDNEFGIPVGELPLARIGDEQGALNKFSALSEFLLGAPGSRLAVAPAMVERAAAKLDAARDAWVQVAERDLGQAFSEQAQQRREADLAAQYGSQIISLCGEPTFETGSVLDDVGIIDPDTCFIKPECRPTFEEQAGRLTSGDLGYALCVHGYLRERAGAAAETSGDPEFDRLADSMPPLGATPFPFIEILDVSADARGTMQVQLQWRDTDVVGTIEPRKQRRTIPMPLSRTRWLNSYYGTPYSGGAAYRDADEYCRVVWVVGEGARPYEPAWEAWAASCETAQECPPGRLCRALGPNPGFCETRRGQAEALARAFRPTGDICFQGALGQSLLAIKAANAAVTAAQERLADKSRYYQNKHEVCLELERKHDLEEGALLRHQNRVEMLEEAKEEAEFWSDLCGVVTGGLGIGLGIDLLGDFASPEKKKGTRFSKAVNAAGVGVGVTAAIGQLFYDASVEDIEAKIEQANADLQAELTDIENDYQEFACFNEAQRELIGTGEAAAELTRASIEYRAAVARMLDQKNELRRLVEEGRAALEAERSMRLPTIEGDFWLSEHITAYERALRQAKRAVFLAALAAEYELQMSSFEADRALAADSADELAQVVDRLRGWTATGTVSGANPTELVNVVSVRDHILQLHSNKTIAEGWYDLSEAERFRMMVTSKAFAVVDASGAYVGQEIPFDILPSSRTGAPDTSGISILSGEDCAERIWSVNASIVGTNLHTTDTNMTRVTLRKNHSFFSQWCGIEGPDGSEFQEASSSRRNLFVDPLAYGDADLPQTPAPLDPERTFASARLQPRFNVAQGVLESEGYLDGDSQELAGRGLYGAYSLFIPAESLALGGGDGLRLSQVEDILLRFDYVSVAR